MTRRLAAVVLVLGVAGFASGSLLHGTRWFDGAVLAGLAALLVIEVAAHRRRRQAHAALLDQRRLTAVVAADAARSVAATREILERVGAASAAVTSERLHGELDQVVDRIGDLVAHSDRYQVGALRSVRAAVDQMLRREFRQLEATTHLAKLLDLPLLAGSRGWAVSPDLMREALALVQRDRPGLVVECGSGTSTVLFAAFARRTGASYRVVALEHEAEYAERTTALLAAHGLQDHAEVRLAPLVPQPVGDRSFRWYSPEAVADLSGIDLLLVDGPPQSTGDEPRYPAVPLLLPRLSERAVVLVDDTARDEDAAVVRRWAAEHPFDVQTLPLEKGAAVLRRRSVTSGHVPS